jgi:phosphoribosylamine--glycine ligase
MKILVIGSGGREHAISWQCAKFDSVEAVFVAPGNAGTQLEDKLTNVDIGVEDIGALIEFAKNNGIDITIVGPEAPLVIGVVDAFASLASCCVLAIITPLPAAKPSALITIGVPFSCTYFTAGSTSVKTS